MRVCVLLIQSNYKLECKRAKHPQQALRLGLLIGQVLERSDNPATIRRKCQLLRVGLSKPSTYRRVNTQINPNRQSPLPHHKPLGLVSWQGRRWSEATTLPQSAAKVQPLRVGLSNRPLIGLLSTDCCAFCRLAGNAYLCIRKGEERSW